MIFLLKHTTGKWHDCDCCGSYISEGKYIYVNNKLAWKQYTDGHMYGETSEGDRSLLILNAWNEEVIKQIEAKHTETKRHEWNKKYSGNAVASTTDSWNQNKENELRFHQKSFTNIVENCANLPYEEFLALKMIALWIESETGDEIKVIKEVKIDCEEEYA